MKSSFLHIAVFKLHVPLSRRLQTPQSLLLAEGDQARSVSIANNAYFPIISQSLKKYQELLLQCKNILKYPVKENQEELKKSHKGSNKSGMNYLIK